MRTIHGVALAICLVLLAGGCTTLRRAAQALVPGRPAQDSRGLESAGVVAGADGSHLERHGFAILNFRAIRDFYDQVSVVGEIKNTGGAARGVELQASLRDSSGRVVAVGHFYPASYRNIVPGETWPFTYSFGRQEGAVDAELRIVGAFRTMDVVNVASVTP